ncbi:TetR/AcrR family transcriptional regulator [Rhizobium sp. BK376]|uniref:TetR/AcrR family transcriptional regulator n=1 Tax=Rhizobium sp. BK376 TaxID=2512149 RepID=UPI0010525D69|nr:TetR/AcrR family transcriptional regulator [Rhizobium sp. BK376]TCR91931.1 TetR family transcriptional regulator [Rhizobium sp. BK376]
MSEAHHRKKQPVLVRQQLLEVAARLASAQGMTAVTLDAVSAASGVSKGGLLHHFPNKNALLEALFDSLVIRLDSAIEDVMRDDPIPHGRFTRAYLQAVLALRNRSEESKDWAQVTMAMLVEPRLRQRWRDWVRERSEEYIGTDSSANAQIVRLAADGLWLADILGSHEMDERERQSLIAGLIELTLK